MQNSKIIFYVSYLLNIALIGKSYYFCQGIRSEVVRNGNLKIIDLLTIIVFLLLIISVFWIPAYSWLKEKTKQSSVIAFSIISIISSLTFFHKGHISPDEAIGVVSILHGLVVIIGIVIGKFMFDKEESL